MTLMIPYNADSLMLKLTKRMLVDDLKLIRLNLLLLEDEYNGSTRQSKSED